MPDPSGVRFRRGGCSKSNLFYFLRAASKRRFYFFPETAYTFPAVVGVSNSNTDYCRAMYVFEFPTSHASINFIALTFTILFHMIQ